MARIATDQATVVQAVVARLISQIDSLTTANCYEVAEPEPAVERTHNLFVQVSVGDGRFNDSALAGGGEDQTFEESLVWVTLFSRIMLDQTQHARQALYDSSRGLLTLKKEILTALTGHDLQNGDSDEILINLMVPVSAARPIKDWEKFSTIAVAFSTDFEWDLS